MRCAIGAIFLAAIGVVGLQGCNSGCDDETIDRAVAFLNSHQSCQTTDDCVTVGDFCRKIPGGFCGQLPMNRSGAESAEWKALERELGDCSSGEECTVCQALLVPTCTAGSCRGR